MGIPRENVVQWPSHLSGLFTFLKIWRRHFGKSYLHMAWPDLIGLPNTQTATGTTLFNNSELSLIQESVLDAEKLFVIQVCLIWRVSYLLRFNLRVQIVMFKLVKFVQIFFFFFFNRFDFDEVENTPPKMKSVENKQSQSNTKGSPITSQSDADETIAIKSFYGNREKKSFPHSPKRRRAVKKVLEKLSDEENISQEENRSCESEVEAERSHQAVRRNQTVRTTRWDLFSYIYESYLSISYTCIEGTSHFSVLM